MLWFGSLLHILPPDPILGVGLLCKLMYVARSGSHSMTTPVSFLPICHICNKPVALEFAKADEQGRTVHEGCYLLKVRKVTIPPEK
jgi:hypothetical protein